MTTETEQTGRSGKRNAGEKLERLVGGPQETAIIDAALDYDSGEHEDKGIKILFKRGIYAMNHYHEEIPYLEAHFSLTNGMPKELDSDSEVYFITNREIRDSIKSLRDKRETIGKMKVSYRDRTMLWESYYPFVVWGTLGLAMANEGDDEIIRAYKGKGIAQLLEYIFLKKVKQEFPEVEKIHHESTELERQYQLRRRPWLSGMWISGATYNFDIELDGLRDKIASDTKQRRNRYQPPQPN